MRSTVLRPVPRSRFAGVILDVSARSQPAANIMAITSGIKSLMEILPSLAGGLGIPGIGILSPDLRAKNVGIGFVETIGLPRILEPTLTPHQDGRAGEQDSVTGGYFLDLTRSSAFRASSCLGSALRASLYWRSASRERSSRS